MSQSVCRTTCTFLWVTKRIKLETHFWEMSGRTQKRFMLSIKARGLIRYSNWIWAITTIVLRSVQLQAFVGSWAGELGPPPARLYSLFRRAKNWYAWGAGMTCYQASPEVQYLKPRTWKRALLDRRRQRMPRLVKKGSLTTCLTTDSAGTLGNSGIKSGKEWAECSGNG